MSDSEGVRIDIWLWAVRAFKTRSLATKACRKGAVVINGAKVKASRTVRPGEVVEVSKRFLTETFEVLELLERRVGAREVSRACRDLTPPEAREAATARYRETQAGPTRSPGGGRPTKRERRELQAMESREASDAAHQAEAAAQLEEFLEDYDRSA